MSFPARFALLALFLAAAARADFHVAPGGADSSPGTASKPFATLERARDAVRTLKSKGPLPKGPLTVWIHGGDHRRTSALELTTADSGTPDSPIRWESAPNENARLLGGLAVPAAAWKPVTDAAVLDRLDPAARANVRQVDLRAMGIRDFGEMKSRGFSRSTVAAHCELFHGGRPMTLARWPNDGQFTRIAGFPATSGKGDDHGGNIGDIAGGFTYEGDRPSRWRDRTDVWVHGYWAWDWANSYEKAESIDLTQHLVRTAPPHGLYGFRKGQRFQFLNVLEELDQRGEWYLDRKSGLAWFWPPAPPTGTAPGNAEPQLGVSINSPCSFTFRGLERRPKCTAEHPGRGAWACVLLFLQLTSTLAGMAFCPQDLPMTRLSTIYPASSGAASLSSPAAKCGPVCAHR